MLKLNNLMVKKSILTSFISFVNSWYFIFQTQKNMEKQDLKKMNFLFEASKSVFYECFNAISICTKDLQWYWSCNKSQGCENYIGH